MDENDIDFASVLLEFGIVWSGIRNIFINFRAPSQSLDATYIPKYVRVRYVHVIENGDRFSA